MGIADWLSKGKRALTNARNQNSQSLNNDELIALADSILTLIKDVAPKRCEELFDESVKTFVTKLKSVPQAGLSPDLIQEMLHAKIREMSQWSLHVIDGVNAELSANRSQANLDELIKRHTLPLQIDAVIIPYTLNAGFKTFQVCLEAIHQHDGLMFDERHEEYERMWLLHEVEQRNLSQDLLVKKIRDLLGSEHLELAGTTSALLLAVQIDVRAKLQAQRFRKLFLPVFIRSLSDGTGAQVLNHLAEEHRETIATMAQSTFSNLDVNNEYHLQLYVAYVRFENEMEEIVQETVEQILESILKSLRQLVELMGITEEDLPNLVNSKTVQEFGQILEEAEHILLQKLSDEP